VVKLEKRLGVLSVLDVRKFDIKLLGMPAVEGKPKKSVKSASEPSIDITSEKEGNEYSEDLNETGDGAVSVVEIMNLAAGKGARIGLSVAEPQVFYSLLETDWNLSGSKLQKKVQQELTARHEEYANVSKDSIGYTRVSEGRLLGVIRPSELPMLQYISEAEKLSGRRFPKISFVESAEFSLVNLVLDSFPPDESSVTLILHVTPDHSRFVFLKGRNIHHISAMIGDGADTPGAMSTLYSRLLYDLDTLDLPHIDRVVLTGLAYAQGLQEYFDEAVQEYFDSHFSLGVKEYFIDGDGKQVPVGPFNFDHFDISLVEGGCDALAPYAVALGAALRALDPTRCAHAIDLTPSRVRENQNILKISTPGWILLTLIPVIIAFSLVRQHRLELELRGLRSQIESKGQTQQLLQDLDDTIRARSTRFSEYEKSFVIIDSLMVGTDRFGSFLVELMRLKDSIRGLWFTDISAGHGNEAVIAGFSVTRSHIPQLVDALGNAELSLVEVQEIREKTVYRFEIRVHLGGSGGS